MYFIRYLRSCLRGLLRFLRSWATSCWRFLSRRLSLPYTDRINMESDDECQYDSTWEDENKKETNRKNKAIYSHRSRRNDFAARDMQDFRHRCPKIKDDKDEDGDDDSDGDDGGKPGKDNFPNLEFYRGRKRSSPDGVHIDEFHKDWWGDYNKLEEVHSYIQWLFPLQEPGMNWKAKELTEKEIKLFRKDKQAKRKLVKSYKMMLDFYGMQLVNEKTGEVQRAPKWEDRFWNLNRYSHNNLRITRILKCLGTLGLQHYQAPLVKFFLRETLIEKQLPKVKQSVLDYFMFAVLDKSERQELVRFAYEHFWPQEDFVWGPKKKLSEKEVTDSKDEVEPNPKGVVDVEMNENMSDRDDGRNSLREEDKENIPSGDQETYHKNKTECQQGEDKLCNESESMQTDELENNLESNDNSQQGGNICCKEEENMQTDKLENNLGSNESQQGGNICCKEVENMQTDKLENNLGSNESQQGGNICCKEVENMQKDKLENNLGSNDNSQQGENICCKEEENMQTDKLENNLGSNDSQQGENICCKEVENMQKDKLENNLGSNDNSQQGENICCKEVENMQKDKLENNLGSNDNSQQGEHTCSKEVENMQTDKLENNLGSNDNSQQAKDICCNEVDNMQTDELKYNLGSNDNSQSSSDNVSVESQSHQTEEKLCHSQDANYNNGNVDQTIDNNQSIGSNEMTHEIIQSNQGTNEDGSSSPRLGDNDADESANNDGSMNEENEFNKNNKSDHRGNENSAA